MPDDGLRKTGAPQGREAYDRLIEAIRAGSLLPGDRLTETDLAARLGISRTPVREAIRLLEADGLVTHVPRFGAVIRQLDYSEVTELYDMRTTLEATAAGLAARAASDVEIDEIAAINAEMAAAGSNAERADLNRQFHLALLDAAKNRYLIRAVSTLQKSMLILGPTTMAETKRFAQAADEHEWVVAALRARDQVDAENAMRQHMQGAQRMRLRQLRLRERQGEDGV
ncbi:GntR family transcriptional regulator [Oceanicola sp. 22II-s10i]|uniref:GntR family transcriptional regulator n=1 Tax=Oceanicola sp. 22II-s10i TaxID=1317116 RepID=UPI000B529055|nr:GntR family transcriptional regulator [Oceanicola sp. 22II-s10i]